MPISPSPFISELSRRDSTYVTMWFLLPLHYVRFNNFGVTGVRPLKKHASWSRAPPQSTQRLQLMMRYSTVSTRIDLGIGPASRCMSIPSAHHPIHVMPSLFPLDVSATGHRMSPLLSTLSSMLRLDPLFNTYFHFGHRTLSPYDAARSVVGRTSHSFFSSPSPPPHFSLYVPRVDCIASESIL